MSTLNVAPALTLPRRSPGELDFEVHEAYDGAVDTQEGREVGRKVPHDFTLLKDDAQHMDLALKVSLDLSLRSLSPRSLIVALTSKSTRSEGVDWVARGQGHIGP